MGCVPDAVGVGVEERHEPRHRLPIEQENGSGLSMIFQANALKPLLSVPSSLYRHRLPIEKGAGREHLTTC